MTVTVRVTQKFPGKSSEFVDQGFESLPAAVKFVGDYMAITPTAHRAIEWIRFELPPQQSTSKARPPRASRARKSVRKR